MSGKQRRFRKDVVFQQNWINAINNFEDMNLKMNVIEGIYENNKKYPTKVQELAIQPIIEGKDTFVVAKEWSGKTVAFCIGILNSIDPELHKTQSIILLPTHGIAYRTYDIMKFHAKRLNISIELFIGGHDIKEDIKKANKEPLIIIGTPGRILDLIRKNKLNFKFLKIICMKGFEHYLDNLKTIELIFQSIPKIFQKLFFTTFFNHKLQDFMNKYMNKPIKIKVDLQPMKYIKHYYYYINPNSKNQIYQFLKKMCFSKCIIFANTNETVEIIQEQFNRDGFSSLAVHSDFTQVQREHIIDDIENERILICDDSILEYINFNNFDMFFNYAIPNDSFGYYRRMCRCHGFMKKGIVINFISSFMEEKKLNSFLEKYNAYAEPFPNDFEQIIEYIHI